MTERHPPNLVVETLIDFPVKFNKSQVTFYFFLFSFVCKQKIMFTSSLKTDIFL